MKMLRIFIKMAAEADVCSQVRESISEDHIFEAINLMGEGFILLTRGYGFMGGGVYHPPFDTLKIGTSTDDIKLKLYR